MRHHPTKLIAGLAAVAVLATVGLFFAPTQVGGSTIYTATVGDSMQPRFHQGDLALLRPGSDYRVGDIVLYESPVFHRPVMHRIIAIQGGHYFFKGDHNHFVDPGYAVRSELLGKLWFHVPRAGALLGWFGAPAHAALLAAFAVLTLLLTWIRPARQRRRRGERRTIAWKPPTPVNLGRYVHRPRKTPENIAAMVAFTLALILFGVGVMSPTRRTASISGAYSHTGAFSYSAHVVRPVDLYPSGNARTGQPIFLNDFKNVHIGFRYQLATGLAHTSTGTIALKARISSDTAWHTAYTLAKPTKFNGDTASVGGTLDLTALRKLIGQLAVDSGAVGAQYTVDVQALTHVNGRVGGKTISDNFAPVMEMTLTQAILKVNASAPALLPGASYTPESSTSTLASAFRPIQPESIPGFAANYVTFARYHVAVAHVRSFGIVLFVLGLLALLFKPLRKRREVWAPERRIALRYGVVVVDVVSFDHARGDSAIDIPDFASLASLAHYSERPILREAGVDTPAYAVEDAGRLYIFQSTAPPVPAPAAAIEPPVLARPVRSPRAPAGKRRRIAQTAALLITLVVSATLFTGLTAANVVPASFAGASSQDVQLAELMPSQCGAIVASQLVVATTVSTMGTAGNDLVLGVNASGTHVLNGSGGDDCIVAGGGAGTTNKLDGGTGTNICIGAPGATNTFKNCSATY